MSHYESNQRHINTYLTAKICDHKRAIPLQSHHDDASRIVLYETEYTYIPRTSTVAKP